MSPRRRRGSALLLSLLVLATVMTVVALAAAHHTQWMQTQLNTTEGDAARRMAWSGLQRALAVLTTTDTARVSTDDEWSTLGSEGGVLFRVGEGEFRLDIVDAGSLMNLNTATQERFEKLPLEVEQIEALLDWRSPEMDARPQGAKDEFYNSLDKPYNTALEPFQTVDELLLVKGFDASTLYEPITDTTVEPLRTGQDDRQPTLYELLTVDSEALQQNVDGEDKLNVNSATVQQMTERDIDQQVAQAIVQRRNTQGTFNSLAEVLEVPAVTLDNAGPLIDELRVGDETIVKGRTNLNTAGEATLRTIADLPDDTIQSILSRNGGFEGVGEIATLPGVTLENLPALAEQFTVSSTTFLVRTVGAYHGRQAALEAVVRIVEDIPRVIKITWLPFSDAPTRWNWQSEPSSEVVLVESS